LTVTPTAPDKFFFLAGKVRVCFHAFSFHFSIFLPVSQLVMVPATVPSPLPECGVQFVPIAHRFSRLFYRFPLPSQWNYLSLFGLAPTVTTVRLPFPDSSPFRFPFGSSDCGYGVELYVSRWVFFDPALGLLASPPCGIPPVACFRSNRALGPVNRHLPSPRVHYYILFPSTLFSPIFPPVHPASFFPQKAYTSVFPGSL